MRKRHSRLYRRGWAWALTLALVLGLVPAPVAAPSPDPIALSEAPEQTYLFNKGESLQNISDFTSYDMTTEGAKGELLPWLKSAPWRYEGGSDSASWLIGSPGVYGYGSLINETTGQSIRIQVLADAEYDVYTNNWFWTSGGRLYVYLRSADEAAEQNELLGQVNTYSSSNSTVYNTPTFLKR